MRLLYQDQGFILQSSMICHRMEALNAEARRTILKWRPIDSKTTPYPDLDEGTDCYFNASGYGTADQAQRQHLSRPPVASTPLEHFDHPWNICRPPLKQEGGAPPSPGSEHLGTHAALHLHDDTSASGRRKRGGACYCADDACVCLPCYRCRSPASVCTLTTHQLPWRPRRRTSEQRHLLAWMRGFVHHHCRKGARWCARFPSRMAQKIPRTREMLVSRAVVDPRPG